MQIKNPTRRPSHRRRGTAAIELMGSIPILLGLMWLVKGSFELGVSRLQNVSQAEFKAYSDATVPTASPADSDTGLIDPVDAFPGALPDLGEDFPNRVHVGQAKQTVTFTQNIALKPVNLSNLAAFASPAWSYSAWPMGDSNGFSDGQTTRDWFSDYAAQVRDDTLVNSLELSPSSPP